MKHFKFIKNLHHEVIFTLLFFLPMIASLTVSFYLDNFLIFFYSIFASAVLSFLFLASLYFKVFFHNIDINSSFAIFDKKNGCLLSVVDYNDVNYKNIAFNGTVIVNSFKNKIKTFKRESEISKGFYLNTQKNGNRVELCVDMTIIVDNVELFLNSENIEVIDFIHKEFVNTDTIKSIKDNSDVNSSVYSTILEIIERNYAAIGAVVKVNAFKVELLETGWVNPISISDNSVHNGKEESSTIKTNKKVLKLTN